MTAVARRRRLALVVVLAVGAGFAWLVAGGGKQGPQRFAPGLGGSAGTTDPLAYDARDRAGFEARAGAGLAHVLYAKSPGGAVATAARVQALRPMILDVARRAHQDPATLEAIVFLESAGRPDAMASDDLRSAAGLTQILAQTATGLLGLKVDLPASTRLTRELARATTRRHITGIEVARRRVDQRFDPLMALEATTRYLAFAQQQLGRDDLAIVSYHMGIGNVQTALKRFGEDGASGVPYAQLFFDSSPVHHAAAWRFLASLGDDSSTYLWRIRAAEQIMRLSRSNPAALRRIAAAQEGDSGARVLRPAGGPASTTPQLVRLDASVLRPGQARLSLALAAAPARARALRPGAAALLRYLAAGVAELAPGAPLVVTGASGADPTGYSFRVSRDYSTVKQAQALQFWLDRLQALDVIAWSRALDTIDITVGPRADRLVGAVPGS